MRAYRFAVPVFLVSLLTFSHLTSIAAPAERSLQHLRCDSLETPLGIDDPAPQFSWQIIDAQMGAKQTAYRLEVSSSRELLANNKADIWDSSRVQSDRSVNVPYAGPALQPERRYFWRVRAWDKDGREYTSSDISWWETGLMSASAWQGKWIGYELDEHRQIREANAQWITNPAEKSQSTDPASFHAFRNSFMLNKPIKVAHLYVTGEETAAAWINGKQVMEAEKLPAYGRVAWMRYREVDATAAIKDGTNLLSVQVTLYHPGGQPADITRAPMSASLYIEYKDGSAQVIKSEAGWKSMLNPPEHWQDAAFNDATWQPAVPYVATEGDMAGDIVHPWPTGPVKMLRHSFQVASPVRSARLYATALGSYNLWVNGNAVGDEILSPGWTDYRDHVAYQVYDVTSSVKQGANAIGAYLAPGWYTTPLMWIQQPYNYGDTPPALRAQLRIEHADGSVQWIATDTSWKADVSPILSAEIYDGEFYDSRREQAGWSTGAFKDAKWHTATEIKPAEPAILAQDYQPIRIEKPLAAKAITSPKPGVYVFDFGQNLAGVERLKMRGAAGTNVRMRFAELLNPDGTIYTENLRSAKATDHYIVSGRGEETYQPLFTFHGFRYIELTGVDTKPNLDALTAEVFHTDAPFTVQLRTGSAMINQLWSNILWGQRSNFVGVPTDCPQRDERLGWTGDAQVFWRTASYDMDLTQFSKKFAADLRGTQADTPMYAIYAPGTNRPNGGFAAGWSDAGVIVPWTSWSQSGDTRVIDQNWTAMQKYLGAIEEESPKYLWEKSGIPFGDWLSPEGTTRQDLLATAYWAHDVDLMQQMAHATGRTQDEEKYAALHEKIKAAFIAAFVHDDGFVAGGEADKNLPDTQTGYVMALAMNLVPDGERAAVAQHLVKKIEGNGGHLGTGFLGTPYLLAALTDTGHADVAYRLLLNTDYPSWGYLVDHGATTMWERWNGDKKRDDPTMNSYNHYAYGAVADWIYRYAAGIDFTSRDAGFHTITLHPTLDRDLASLDFVYQSPYGSIFSSWAAKSDRATWKLIIPPNSSGRLSAREAAGWLLNGTAIASDKNVLRVDGSFVFPAGTYLFSRSLPGMSVEKGF